MTMKLSKELENTLFDYVDGTLTGKEKKDFEVLLEDNPDLKAMYDQLAFSEGLARQHRLESPSRDFTSRVMENLHMRPETGHVSIRDSLFLLGGIMAVAGMCTILLTGGFFDSSIASFNLNEFSVVKKYFNGSLPSVGLNVRVLLNIIVFLNLVMALIVLDRSVLKPLFQKRLDSGS